MWSYIAGLFDGDGSFSIHQSRSGNSTSLVFSAKITGSRTEEEFKPIVDFLRLNNVNIAFQRGNRGKDVNGWRRKSTNVIVISSYIGVKDFVEGIYPYIIFKKEHCDIMLEAITMRLRLKSRGYGTIKDNMQLFDVLRYALHDLSVKGPRTLKPWI